MPHRRDGSIADGVTFGAPATRRPRYPPLMKVLILPILTLSLSALAQAPGTSVSGHWTMDDSRGSEKASDSTLVRNTGVCGKETNIGSGEKRTPRCPAFGVPGKIGTAAHFAGAEAVIVKNFITLSFTVAAWIRTTDGGDGAIIWSDTSGAAPDSIPMALLDGHVSFRTGECFGHAGDTLTSKAKINTGKWIHVAVARDAKTGAKQIYIDGVLDAGNDSGGKCPLNATPIVAFGGNLLDGRFFTGDLDDVWFYDRPLTAAEITKLMRSH